MSSAKSNVQRSWTPSDEPGSKNWFVIAFLALVLAAAILGFIYYSLWKRRPVTFVTSLAVPEYSEKILPQPAYPDWNLVSLSKSLPEFGLESWKIAKKAEVKTGNDIVQWLDALRGELDKNGLNEQDTVVVYLRAHAINQGGKAFLLASEFERKVLFDETKDADDLIGAVSLEDVFRDLRRVNASQVVLLADICDLQTAPKLGIIANDVPNLVASELEKLSDGTPLWVITASASLQTTHASDLKKRTLLQSASEYALNSRHCDSGDEFLSLAVFYEAVLRYSYHVTDKQQTPLLFRNGNRDPVTDPISPAWKKASKVSFARFDSAKSKASKQVEDAIQPKSAATDTAASAATSKEKDPVGTESAEGKKDDKKDGVEVVETTPSLRYWQLRDKLQSRTTLSPEGWSPVDFAAEDWLKSSLEAVQLERLIGIGNDEAKKDLKALVDELEELSRALQSNSPIVSADNRFKKASQAITSEMTPESDKGAWRFPNDLPEKQEKQWRDTRANYRIYFDAMGQLSGWLNAALNEQEQNRIELLSTVDNLVVALVDLQVDLPNADDSLLDKPLPASKVEMITRALKQLREKRNKQVNDLLTRLNAAKSKSKPILWADERAIQQLLLDTNLTYENRYRIRIALVGLTAEQLNEPGTANNDVDKLLDVTSLLNPSQVRSSSLKYYATWCSLYSRAIANTGATETLEPSGSTAENLNCWGHDLIVKFKTAPDTTDPTMCWKQACLNELQIFNFSGEGRQSGMLLSVSKDENIDVVVPKQFRLSSAAPQPLNCTVKRHNGTRIPECWLQWELIEPVKHKESTRALLSVKQGSDNLDPGMLYPVTVRGGKVDLMMTSSKDSKDFREGLKIRIGIVTEQSAKEPLWHEVQVLLPNPDRIDLYAKCLDPAVGNSRVFYSKEVNFGSVLSGLSVPAVNGQVKSRYELYLLNRSDEAKTVRAKLYAVAGGRTNGNGSISSNPSKPTASDTPYFQTTSPIVLPKNAGQLSPDGASPVGGVRIELAAVPNAAGEIPKSLNIGEFGLVLVIEEIEVGENNVERPLDKKTYQWIECKYTKPVGELLKITPIASEGVFDFKLEVPPSNWAHWGLKELEIKAHLTDAKGVGVAPGSTSLTLTPDMTEATLKIKPKQPSANGKLVVHFDIGGYPRAIAFDSWLKGELDETRNASQAFVWLEPDGALFYTGGKDSKLVAAYPKDKETLIIPRREHTADAEIGKEISITRFSMPFRVDFPRAGDKSATFSLSEGNLSQKFLHDRRFIPTFEIEGGNLVFSAAVEDLIADFAIQNAGLNGKVNAQVTVTESTSETCALVFDRDPPNKASVECSSRELFEGESISISLDSSDEDSAVNQVFFAIDQSGINEGEFDKNDLIHCKAHQLDGKWVATLEATMFEKLPPGRYSIVARSIDMAENVQDGNTPRQFHWMGKKRAADKPATQPSTKKTVADPPKKIELKKTILVQVTVDGQQPANPRNIQVKGIPGASEKKNGATTIFTEVPEGAYDVTATYKDAFGKPFEGSGKIKVSADSPSILRIDLKPLK